jgi:hypothetical protein
MQTEELPSDLLLPPKRLGTLLAEARLAGGYSLVEAADSLGDTWSPVELLQVETGLRPVLDPDLEVLTDLYGIQTTSLIPERSRLVIDLDEGVLGVGSQQVVLGGDTVQEREVLGQYLAMVYTMRDLRPGLSVPLRTPDLEVLSTALHRPTEELEAELRQMMVDAGTVVEPRMRRLRGRILIPAVGLIVAATTAGMLLLVNDSEATPAPDGTNAPAAVTTDIGDAVVQERLPDGSPGPVEVRN